MPHPGFEELASGWDDDPLHRERASAVAAAIVEAVDLRGAHVIEDGCGTGLLGFALLERVELARLTFIDPSPAMREVVERKVAALAPDRARVLAPGEDPDHPADLVTSLMVLHHVDEPDAAIEAWIRWLAPTGHLALADLFTEDGSFHGLDVEDVHRGFDPADVAGWMARAGAEAVGSSTVFEIEKTVDGSPRVFPVWLVLGRRV